MANGPRIDPQRIRRERLIGDLKDVRAKLRSTEDRAILEEAIEEIERIDAPKVKP